jgi:AraC family transcriptional regulator
MLQSVNTSGQTSFPPTVVNPIIQLNRSWNQRLRNKEAAHQTRKTDDIARAYPDAVVSSSDASAWQNIRIVHLRDEIDQMVAAPSSDHCLVVNIGTSLQIRAELGERSFAGELLTGQVAIMPASTSWVADARGINSQNIVLLYLRPFFVRNAAEQFQLPFSELALKPEIGFQSGHIRHIALSLLDELKEANVVGRLYAESLATALTMQMIKCYSALREVRLGQGGMAPHRLRKAVSLIDQHLENEEEGRVELRAVAKEVGMSYFHFSRAFKQSMGMTPTSYIAERRIEHARTLMQDTALPISEIALRAGFSSQSHFTTSFRRLAGVTPRSFRKGM